MTRLRRGNKPSHMARRQRRPLWHLAISGLIMSATMVALLYNLWRDRSRQATRPQPTRATIEQVDNAVALASLLVEKTTLELEELGLWPDLVSTRIHQNAIDTITVLVPADLPLAMVNLRLTLFVQTRGGQVLRGRETSNGQRVELECGLDSIQTTLFILEQAPHLRRHTGRIAIVLDNFGSFTWEAQLLERFCSLPHLLTLAIPPNEGRVRDIVARAKSHGHEILVHMPSVPAFRRDLLLDADSTKSVIEARLWELAGLAATQGQAIGIGHDRKSTLLTLEAVLPRLESRGYHFVTLSQLDP